MSGQRVLGVSLLLCVVAACASRTGSTPPRPIAPQDGPKAFIRATYSGGLLYRWVDASFQVDQYAYVLVGHLGGDGVIRVLYPTNARERGVVRPGKSLRTRSFDGRYDTAPAFYFARTAVSRGLGAMMDSYDGQGNGYIFMIASRSPLAYDEVSEGGLWDELDVANYYNFYDPRLAVRDFAELVSGGWPFTLKFASSFNSFNTNAFANSYECALLASAGFLGYNSMWSTFGSSPWSFGGRRSPCSRNRYAYFGSPRPTYYTAVATTPTPPAPRKPTNVPTLGRPTHRPGSAPRRTLAADRSPFGGTDRGIASRTRDFGAHTSSRPMRTETTRISRPTDGPRLDQPRQPATTTVAPQPNSSKKQ